MKKYVFTFVIVKFVFYAGVQTLTITPDKGSTFNISNRQVKGCQVCSGTGNAKLCGAFLYIKDNSPTSVNFGCSRPQDVFTVEISRTIGKSCTTDAGSNPFLDFKRKFTWILKAEAPKAFKISFTGTGLRQINPSESCPDRLSYTLQAAQSTGIVTVGKYCRTGAIRSAQILKSGMASLMCMWGRKSNVTLAKVTLRLPSGTSTSELLSPNYPDSFPDDDVMEWHVEVPDKHKTTLRFSNLTEPSCLKKETAVEYHIAGRAALVLRLSEPQQEQIMGDFTMILRNCEMDRRRLGSSGLKLNVQVSTSRTDVPGLYLTCCSFFIGSKTEETFCLSLSVSGKFRVSTFVLLFCSDSITVTSKSELSFKGCLPTDVRTSLINDLFFTPACRQLKDCPKPPVRLLLPTLPSCLPAPLSSVTWMLRPPIHGTVELTAPTGPLMQVLPEQPCNDSILIEVAEEDGVRIGQFCPQGVIQKIQIHTNMSVTVSRTGSNTLRTSYRNVLDACFKEEISGEKMPDTPVLLATPGWPVGMKPYSTVSWIVSVPPRMEAHLMFDKLSQPKCTNRHTNIRVQRVGSREEDYSRREDEEAEQEIVVPAKFYLNMSNCLPEKGHFSLITKITLKDCKSKGCLQRKGIFITVTEKKKKALKEQVSIYNPNGTIFLPGHTNFPKSRADNESHVYESIEDTLVYTHLLRKGMEIGVYGETDTYNSFTGHTESQKPLVSKEEHPPNSSYYSTVNVPYWVGSYNNNPNCDFRLQFLFTLMD
uniref:CUB domain containing protein 1a n=1 Tax=Cynoglossus semilaevis TaxID=244447 RepID=A0A3P8V0P0_CYNSE